MPRTLNKTAIRFNRFSVQRDADGDITFSVNYAVETAEGETIERSEARQVSGAFKTQLESIFTRVEGALNTKEGL